MGKGGVFVLRTIMRRAIRVLWIVTIMIIIGMIPWMITSMEENHYSPVEIVQTVAGVFTLGACLLSIWQMTGHLDHFRDPKLQTPILRILLMVPIYALNCWLALMCKDLSIYLDTFRKIYEAFVLNQFFVFLTTYLSEKRPWETVIEGDEGVASDTTGSVDRVDAAIEVKLRKKKPQPHIFPFCWLEEWPVDKFVGGCRTGINSYVFFRVFTAIIELVLLPFGWYKPGDLSFDAPYLYCTLINNCTSMWAIYCLILFYVALESDLRPIHPISKLLCIKAVVFFSWWQSVILVIVEDCGLLKNHASWTDYDEGDIALGLQDLCICVEMLFVALAHMWSFSYKDPYLQGPQEKEEGVDSEKDTIFYRAVRMFDFRDIGEDVNRSIRHPVTPGVDWDTMAPLLRAANSSRTTEGQEEEDDLEDPESKQDANKLEPIDEETEQTSSDDHEKKTDALATAIDADVTKID